MLVKSERSTLKWLNIARFGWSHRPLAYRLLSIRVMCPQHRGDFINHTSIPQQRGQKKMLRLHKRRLGTERKDKHFFPPVAWPANANCVTCQRLTHTNTHGKPEPNMHYKLRRADIGCHENEIKEIPFGCMRGWNSRSRTLELQMTKCANMSFSSFYELSL